MKNIWTCRRTYLATLAILVLGAMAMVKGIDTSLAIAAASGAVAAANAFQAKKAEPPVEKPPVEGEQP